MTAREAAAHLVANPFPTATELRDGLRPAVGCVDLFTGEEVTIYNLDAERRRRRGAAQASLFD